MWHIVLRTNLVTLSTTLGSHKVTPELQQESLFCAVNLLAVVALSAFLSLRTYVEVGFQSPWELG